VAGPRVGVRVEPAIEREHASSTRSRSACASSSARATGWATSRCTKRSFCGRARRTWPGRRCCGAAGYGHSSRLHTTKLLELSSDLSYVVEIVDAQEKIDAFLPELDAMMIESGGSGLVTLERAQVLQYGPRAQ